MPRSAARGARAGPTPQIPAQWSAFVFPVNDLPLEGLSSLRVRFDLLGAGEVWIDDVRLCDLAFNKKELVEMSRLISPAERRKLQRGQVADCLRVLDSYWARFLVDQVPAAALPSCTAPSPSRAAPPENRPAPPRAPDSWSG